MRSFAITGAEVIRVSAVYHARGCPLAPSSAVSVRPAVVTTMPPPAAIPLTLPSISRLVQSSAGSPA